VPCFLNEVKRLSKKVIKNSIMIKLKFSIFILLYIMIVSACVSVYIPAEHNVTLFKNEREIQISGGLNSTSLFYPISYYTNFAINPIKYVGLTTGYSSNCGHVGGFWVGRELIQNQFHLGLGGYIPINENLIFETYFIKSFGLIKYGDSKGYSLKFNDFSIQPAIGYRNQKIFIALSSTFINRRYIPLSPYYSYPYSYDKFGILLHKDLTFLNLQLLLVLEIT
jgi:hypothetical protein